MNKNEMAPRLSGFLDRDTEFTGDLKFKDNLRIDGVFKGKILSGNGLIIGDSADIDAEIEVNRISINGRVKGSIKAKETIEIFSKGRVLGNIITPKITIEDGAFFQGSCQMELKVLDSKNQNPSESANK